MNKRDAYKWKKVTVLKRLQKAHAFMREAHARYTTKLEDIKAHCPHEWVLSKDPTGGTDSDYHCVLCDARTKHRPE